MDDGPGQEEYIRQVLNGPPRQTGCWRRNCINVGFRQVIENALVLAATRRLIRPAAGRK